MELVQIDPIGLEPAQRILARAEDVIARIAALVGSVAHRVVHLGRQDDLIAAAVFLERATDDPFALAGVVDVRRVDEIDARLERAVNDADRVFGAGRSPEIHSPQAQRRDLDAGASQHTVFHSKFHLQEFRNSVYHK